MGNGYPAEDQPRRSIRAASNRPANLRCYVYAVDANAAAKDRPPMLGGGQTLRKSVAAGIKARRRARGWSQEHLAHEAGLHRTFIGQVERSESNLSIDNLERISKALGMHACELLCAAESETSELRTDGKRI